MFLKAHLIAALALIATVYGPQAQAERRTLSSIYNEWLDNKVTFVKCSPASAQTAKQIFKDGTTSAIASLLELNPALIQPKLQASFQRNLTLSCERAPGGAVADFGSGSDRSTIRMGRLIDVTMTGTEARIFLIHEYFHFLKLDNLPTSTHNHEDFLRTPDASGTYGIEYDVVYSCMMAVEPLAHLHTVATADRNIAIRTCASAKPTATGSQTGMESHARKPSRAEARRHKRPPLASALGLIDLSRDERETVLDQWMNNYVTYKACSPTQKSEAQELLRVSVQTGFNRLSEINPELVEERMNRRYLKRKLIVTCEPSAHGSAHLMTWRWLGRNARPPEIAIGNILVSGADAEAKMSTVFHEVLHFFNFDNVESALHNDAHFLMGFQKPGVSGYELDVVYSCQKAIFASRELLRQTEYDNSRATCAAAKPARSKTVLPD